MSIEWKRHKPCLNILQSNNEASNCFLFPMLSKFCLLMLHFHGGCFHAGFTSAYSMPTLSCWIIFILVVFIVVVKTLMSFKDNSSWRLHFRVHHPNKHCLYHTMQRKFVCVTQLAMCFVTVTQIPGGTLIWKYLKYCY